MLVIDHGFDIGVKLQPFGGATVSLAASKSRYCIPNKKHC